MTFAIPPPPPRLHFRRKFEWLPLWILPKFSVISPFGFSVTTGPHLCSPKNQVIPQNPPRAINKDRSLRIGRWAELILHPHTTMQSFSNNMPFGAGCRLRSRLFRWGILLAKTLPAEKVWLSHDCLFLRRESVGATGKPMWSAHSKFSFYFIKRKLRGGGGVAWPLTLS